MMKTSLIILLSFLFSIGYAQEIITIDSLKHELAIAMQDTSKVKIGIALSSDYWGINPDSSFKYGQQALALAQQIEYHLGESRSLHSLGVNYRNLGDYAKALDLTFKGLQIGEKYKLTSTITCLNGIALIYGQLKDYPKALDYFRRALNLAVANQHHYWTTQLEMNIGSTYIDINQIDSASYYINRAHLKAILPENTMTLSRIYTLLGELQFRQGNYEKAFEYVHKNIVINKSMDDHRSLSGAYHVLSNIFKELNQPDSSIFYAKKGILEAQEINLKSGILNGSKLLAELYEPIDIKTSLYYYKIANSANDDLYGPTKTLDLQKTLAEEQERQRQKEVQRMEYENQLKQYGYLTGLAVLLLIAFLLYRNNRQKHSANIYLQQQKDKVDKTLSQLKSTQSQLIQSEKMASLGELTAGIAHEIQNPLNFVNNFSEVNTELIKEIQDERRKTQDQRDNKLEDELLQDIVHNQEKINHHGKRAADIVKGMLQHSQSSSGKKEPTDINALADEYLRLAYHGLRAKDKSFNAELKTDFNSSIGNINIIPQDIGRVVLNLINNAFYAVKEKVKQGIPGFEPTVSVSTKNENNRVLISVKDNGNGIPKKTLDKIFQPFFTTKPTGQGTGLGLSLSYDIVKAHGGELSVETREGEGSEFIVELPLNK